MDLTLGKPGWTTWAKNSPLLHLKRELKQFVMKLIIFMLTMSQLGEAPPA
jgi:hypothetical protein